MASSACAQAQALSVAAVRVTVRARLRHAEVPFHALWLHAQCLRAVISRRLVCAFFGGNRGQVEVARCMRRVAASQQVTKVRPPVQCRHVQRASHLAERLKILICGCAQVTGCKLGVAVLLRGISARERTLGARLVSLLPRSSALS
jgi:RNase P subunit RPR2